MNVKLVCTRCGFLAHVPVADDWLLPAGVTVSSDKEVFGLCPACRVDEARASAAPAPRTRTASRAQ